MADVVAFTPEETQLLKTYDNYIDELCGRAVKYGSSTDLEMKISHAIQKRNELINKVKGEDTMLIYLYRASEGISGNLEDIGLVDLIPYDTVLPQRVVQPMGNGSPTKYICDDPITVQYVVIGETKYVISSGRPKLKGYHTIIIKHDEQVVFYSPKGPPQAILLVKTPQEVRNDP